MERTHRRDSGRSIIVLQFQGRERVSILVVMERTHRLGNAASRVRRAAMFQSLL